MTIKFVNDLTKELNEIKVDLKNDLKISREI